MENKSVVVTGGAGFLGSHVVARLLEKKCEVTVIDDFSNGKMMHLESYKNNPLLKITRADIAEQEQIRNAFDNCQIIIHLATLCLRQSLKEPKKVVNVIVNGTLNCLQAAIENNVELFINCSSSEVYGSAQYTPMDEKHPLNPTTPYAAAKVEQDMLVKSYGFSYGLNWTTIRPFNMYGPNSHWQGHRGELIPRMIVNAMNRQPLTIFGDGLQTRDFVFVKDTAKAIVSMADKPECFNNEINFSTGTESTVREIAGLICKLFDLDPEKYIQKQQSRPGNVERLIGDNSKFNYIFGFTPETILRDGLKSTINWFKSLPFSPEELLSQVVDRNWV